MENQDEQDEWLLRIWDRGFYSFQTGIASGDISKKYPGSRERESLLSCPF
jgi:hypothetical protein